MHHANSDANLTSISDVDLSGYSEYGEIDNMTIPICRYYDIESGIWKSDGCVTVFSNESMSKCLCSHLTQFSINSNDFEPDIHIITKEKLENVTFSNIIKYPTALIVTVSILFLFLLIILCLPRNNDKPIIAQMRPWCELQASKWIHTYDFRMDEIMTSTEYVWWIKFIDIAWLDLKNNHYVLAVCMRDYGTNWSGPQRILCFLSSVVTMMSINAAYYGRMDVQYDTMKMDVLLNFWYSSLFGKLQIGNTFPFCACCVSVLCFVFSVFCFLSFVNFAINYQYIGTLVPVVLACIFGYHQPSVAVRRPTSGLGEILIDKWQEYKLDRQATGPIKLDKKQIEFDILGLMAQKDVKAAIVKNNDHLRAYHLKQVINKKNLLASGIQRHVKWGKGSVAKRMSELRHSQSRSMEVYNYKQSIQSNSVSPRASVSGTQPMAIQADIDIDINITRSNPEPIANTIADMLKLALVTSPHVFLRDENEFHHDHDTDNDNDIESNNNLKASDPITPAPESGGTEGETTTKGVQQIQLVGIVQTNQNSSKETNDEPNDHDENAQIESNPFGAVGNFNNSGIGDDSDDTVSQTDFIEWALNGADDAFENTATIRNDHINATVAAPDTEITAYTAQETPDVPDVPEMTPDVPDVLDALDVLDVPDMIPDIVQTASKKAIGADSMDSSAGRSGSGGLTFRRSILDMKQIKTLHAAGITEADIVRSRSGDSVPEFGLTKTTRGGASVGSEGGSINTTMMNSNGFSSGSEGNNGESRTTTTTTFRPLRYRSPSVQYIKRQLSMRSMQANHGRVLMKHFEESNKILVSKMITNLNSKHGGGISIDGGIGNDNNDSCETKETSQEISISEEDHALLTLIQAFLIEISYIMPHFCEYVAWILGSIWIILCSSVIIVYGINFDLASDIDVPDTRNNDYAINNASNCSYEFVEYAVNYTTQINYQLSTEYALNYSDDIQDSRKIDQLFGDASNISDAQSWFFSFLLSFLISIVLWSPLSTTIFAFFKFWFYKLIWKDYYKSNYYYMQCNEIASASAHDDGENILEMKYYGMDRLISNLAKVKTEEDLWKLIGAEIGIKALCQYPLWVLQHPYVKALREKLYEKEHQEHQEHQL